MSLFTYCGLFNASVGITCCCCSAGRAEPARSSKTATGRRQRAAAGRVAPDDLDVTVILLSNNKTQVSEGDVGSNRLPSFSGGSFQPDGARPQSRSESTLRSGRRGHRADTCTGTMLGEAERRQAEPELRTSGFENPGRERSRAWKTLPSAVRGMRRFVRQLHVKLHMPAVNRATSLGRPAHRDGSKP